MRGLQGGRGASSRRGFLATVLSAGALAWLPAGAGAEEGDYLFLGEELVKLLRGRSVQGSFNGKPFTEYFGPDGGTSYEIGDEGLKHGHWKIADTGDLCLTWEEVGLRCYRVYRRGHDYFAKRVDGGAEEFFTVHDGNLLAD